MDNIAAQCPGVLAIHDDIFIYGKDNKDHDANIINLFNVAQKEGLVFNSAKCSIKQDSVTFFGGVFSAKGYSPDPAKIQGITEMTPPDQTRATVISGSSELSANLCAPSEASHRTTMSNPEKKRTALLGTRIQTTVSRK